jgi:hypothetical protein
MPIPGCTIFPNCFRFRRHFCTIVRTGIFNIVPGSGMYLFRAFFQKNLVKL